MSDPTRTIDWTPGLPSPDDFVLSNTPSPSTAGAGKAIVLGLALPWVEMRQDIEAMFRDLNDPEIAGPWALDILGTRYGIGTSGGIPAEQWRRIVAAAKIGSGGDFASLARFWRTLIGADDTDAVTVKRIGAAGDATVSLVGPVKFAPTEQWLVKAGQLVGAVVGQQMGIEWEAVVTRPNTAITGDPWSGYHVTGYALRGGP